MQNASGGPSLETNAEVCFWACSLAGRRLDLHDSLLINMLISMLILGCMQTVVTAWFTIVNRAFDAYWYLKVGNSE